MYLYKKMQQKIGSRFIRFVDWQLNVFLYNKSKVNVFVDYKKQNMNKVACNQDGYLYEDDEVF